MRVYKEKQVVYKEETDVICNKCGQTCKPKYNHIGLCGYISGCYESELFEDNVDYLFDLCEKCVWDLVQTFKIPVEIGNDDDVAFEESTEDKGGHFTF